MAAFGDREFEYRKQNERMRGLKFKVGDAGGV